MYNHEPSDYACPLCSVSNGKETEYNKFSDIIYQDVDLLAFISPKWWINNPGNVIVITKKHVENIYDISDDLLAEISVLSKKIALAMKEVYRCDGTSARQHNEPAGNQDVWHYHLHIFPRWENDDLYLNHLNKKFVEPDERTKYAVLLKEALSQ